MPTTITGGGLDCQSLSSYLVSCIGETECLVPGPCTPPAPKNWSEACKRWLSTHRSHWARLGFLQITSELALCIFSQEIIYGQRIFLCCFLLQEIFQA
jgi:hypothetical protein